MTLRQVGEATWSTPARLGAIDFFVKNSIHVTVALLFDTAQKKAGSDFKLSGFRCRIVCGYAYGRGCT